MLKSRDVLYTDSRTAWALRFLWEYPGIHDFESMGTTEIPEGSYVLIKRWLTDVLDEVYGYILPDFYNDIPDHWRLKWSGHQAELYWIPPEA